MLNIIEKTYKINGNLSIRNSTERIILHHAAASQCSADDIDKWHKQKDYSCIGYHFFIRKDGTIYRGRQENAVGAHAYQNNYNSIGICFEGDFEKEQMTDAQVESAKELVAYLKNKYNISKVQKHKDVNNTSCPGKNFRFDEIANSTVKNTVTFAEVKNEVKGNVATIQSTLNSRYGLNIAVDNIYRKRNKESISKSITNRVK